MYDTSAVLEHENIKVDLVIFENRLTKALPKDEGFQAIGPWINKYKLPKDWNGSWQNSIKEIEVAENRFLPETGHAAGACYFGLNDLTLSEISAICGANDKDAAMHTRTAMSRIRIDQYFNPPTDELILTSLSLSMRHDKAFVKDIYDTAVSLNHKPVANVIVPNVDFSDPIATAKELDKLKNISFSTDVRLNDKGREITHHIEKTAQENFVIRALKVMDIPNIIKEIKGWCC